MTQLPYEVDPGTNTHGLNWRMRIAEDTVTRVWTAELGMLWRMTSAADRAHGPRSWHYKGMAFDISLRGVPRQKVDAVVAHLREKIGPPFQIIHHRGSHVHIECDLEAYPAWIARDIRECLL